MKHVQLSDKIHVVLFHKVVLYLCRLRSFTVVDFGTNGKQLYTVSGKNIPRTRVNGFV